jgi:hypothetical protein
VKIENREALSMPPETNLGVDALPDELRPSGDDLSRGRLDHLRIAGTRDYLRDLSAHEWLAIFDYAAAHGDPIPDC